jgi:hypothetical protein
MAALTARTLAARFRGRFADALHHALSSSGFSFTNDLLSTGVIEFPVESDTEDVNDFESEFPGVDAILISILVDQFDFDEDRLQGWAENALEFARQNSYHPDFLRLFSTELAYDRTLRSIFAIDFSTDSFASRMATDFPEWKAAKPPPVFSAELQSIAANVAEAAIPTALDALGTELVHVFQHKPVPSNSTLAALRKVKKDPSYTDKRGALAFQKKDDHLSIGGVGKTARSQSYRRQLERAIQRISVGEVMARLHNRDPSLSALFEEYNREFSHDNAENSDDTVISLWMIGHDIDNRIRVSDTKASEDEALDENALSLLMTFLTAHNLYLQSFSAIERLSDDLLRSSRIYRKLDDTARKAPWGLLSSLSHHQDVFEDKTQKVLKKAASAVDRPDAENTKGLVGIGLGLLRGALREMAAIILDTMLRVPGNEDEFLAGLDNKPLERAILNFFKVHKRRALEISIQLPNFFHWLRAFLGMLGLI